MPHLHGEGLRVEVRDELARGGGKIKGAVGVGELLLRVPRDEGGRLDQDRVGGAKEGVLVPARGKYMYM